MKAALRDTFARFLSWENTPKGRRWTMLVAIYVVTLLERRGYLPAIPVPKA